MLKLGIRAHDIGKLPAKDLYQGVMDYGFDGVQLVLKKAIDETVDFNDLSNITKYFGKKTNVLMLGAYFNPIHPDYSQVESGVNNFKKHLEIAKQFDCQYVGTETGSLMGSPWGYVKENHSDESLEYVYNIFKDLVKTAEKNQATIAIEGAWAHVCYSPQRLNELVTKLNSKNVKVTIDLYNYLNIDNYENRMEIFKESLEIFKDKIVIFHLKDFVVKDNKLIQVGLGQGLMDYPTIIKLIKQNNPTAYLIFEGVVSPDIKTSYDLIRSLMK